MLVHEEQGIQLSLAQPGDKIRGARIRFTGRRTAAIGMAVCEFPGHRHEWPFTDKDE